MSAATGTPGKRPILRTRGLVNPSGMAAAITHRSRWWVCWGSTPTMRGLSHVPGSVGVGGCGVSGCGSVVWLGEAGVWLGCAAARAGCAGGRVGLAALAARACTVVWCAQRPERGGRVIGGCAGVVYLVGWCAAEGAVREWPRAPVAVALRGWLRGWLASRRVVGWCASWSTGHVGASRPRDGCGGVCGRARRGVAGGLRPCCGGFRPLTWGVAPLRPLRGLCARCCGSWCGRAAGFARCDLHHGRWFVPV